MRCFNYLFLLIPSLWVISCSENQMSFGTVEYYPSFLWEDANITTVKKTFEFDFSLDAKNDNRSFAEFQFVDNNDNPIRSDIMQVYDGDQILNGNRFRVESNEVAKELTFSFSPEASNGKYQGYFKLINHNLDRIESEPIKPGDKLNVFQWTIYYNKTMNPLAKVFLYTFLIVIACCLAWFIILRPLVFPHFGKFIKSIMVKQNDRIIDQLSYNFKGARKVVFYDKKIKQSFWNRIFVGEIKTYVSPYFKTKLIFSPKKKNVSVCGTGYSVNPNPIPKNGIAKIENHIQKLSIILC